MKSIIEKKSKFFNSYFIIVTLLYIVGISFTSGKVGNYMPIFFMLSSSVFFKVSYLIEFNRFDSLLKELDPELFKNNANNYGPFKGRNLNGLIIYNCPEEIKALNNIELTHRFKLVAKLQKFVVFSFVLLPLIMMILFIK